MECPGAAEVVRSVVGAGSGVRAFLEAGVWRPCWLPESCLFCQPRWAWRSLERRLGGCMSSPCPHTTRRLGKRSWGSGQDYQQHPLCDRYLVTFSPLMDTQDDPQAIIIWDILTGQKKRGFHCESSAHWPIFK